jgi:hypothetical protein
MHTLPIFAVLANGAVAQPVQSFTDLRPLVRSGERLVITEKGGKTIRGQLASLSAHELAIRRRRWNFRREEKTWSDDAVWYVEHQDSTWNGTLIGAGVGLASIVVMVTLPAGNRPDDLTCVPLAILAIPGGIAIGQAIDLRINQPLFVSPTRRVVALSGPVLSRDRAGVSLHLRF